MLNPFEAIALLIEAGCRRVELHNEQPHRHRDMALSETVEAQAAELISHYQRRVQELLEANGRYLERARSLQARLVGMQVFTQPSSQHPSAIAEAVGAEGPLTARTLADALDAFWNASVSEGHNRGETAIDCASVMAEGIAAVARQLRQGAPT